MNGSKTPKGVICHTFHFPAHSLAILPDFPVGADFAGVAFVDGANWYSSTTLPLPFSLASRLRSISGIFARPIRSCVPCLREYGFPALFSVAQLLHLRPVDLLSFRNRTGPCSGRSSGNVFPLFPVQFSFRHSLFGDIPPTPKHDPRKEVCPASN